MTDIRCLCLDVDGVLTDGRLYVDDDGRTRRAFHVHDGLAIRQFQKLGGAVLIITGKQSPAVAARAAELGIHHLVQGSSDKLADLKMLLPALNLTLAQVAVIGDDLPELPLFKACGYGIAVANAVDELKSVARFVTRRAGGDGAVREAIEHLLRQSGRWDQVVQSFDPSARPASATSPDGMTKPLRVASRKTTA